jgi:probable HAF family extracellular repeat protein
VDGFLLSGGIYTTIIYPAATYTGPTGINDKGQIVGTANNLGFLYDVATQAFTTISRSGANLTLPFGINNAGQISGTLFYGFNQQVGFKLIGSKYVVIRPPGVEVVNATGISPSGAVTAFTPGSISRNLVLSHGEYQLLSIPNAPGAEVFGISGAGVVGFYHPSPGVTAGFIYQNKTLTTLQFPGSNFTEALGINAAGEVVGEFADAQGNVHGFTWTPPAGDKEHK